MKRVCSVLLLLARAPSWAAEPDACDAAAAHPSDPDRVGAGVPTAQVVTHVAIPACRAAVEREPEEARFRYQLGRALVYWARANEASADEGVAHVRAAAERGYRQAEFVLGLLYAERGDRCAAEPWYKAAADQGLKSARLTYVDEAVAGRLADCGSGATRAELAAYLDGASSQVSGYYENMLVQALRRQLEANP